MADDLQSRIDNLEAKVLEALTEADKSNWEDLAALWMTRIVQAAILVFLVIVMVVWLTPPRPKPNPCEVLLDLSDDLRKLERAWPRDGHVAHRIERNEAMARALRRCYVPEKGGDDD